ncbi:lanosterol 14-alpha-demethylase [Gautieria morchelliformis]|nr:lanosterol 14-alpha-demethylase [Gautieria morchelliformis]
MICLFIFPVIVIIMNVLRQLIIPRDPYTPPLVFHWLPVIGSAIEYGSDPVNFLARCRAKHGDIFTFILLGRRMTAALGPKGSNFVLGAKLTHASAEDVYAPLTTPVFGAGVVYDCPNHVFMEQKKFVKGGFSTANLRAYVPMIENEVEDFLEHDNRFSTYQLGDVKEWGSFHAYRTMAEITTLTAARTLQGREVRGSLDKTFAARFHDLDGGFTPLNMIFPNLPLPSYKRRDIAQKAMSDFYVNIIKKRKAEVFQEESDMIAVLCSQSYKDGRPFTEREVAHLLTALLMAGQHTSSTSGAWALMHIAAEPGVADALYKEQMDKFSSDEGSHRSLTFEDMKKLPLLDAVIRETLRIHPPIHSLLRKVITDMPVPPTLSAPDGDSHNFIVPRGHFLVASPAVSQMDPTVWADPDKWDPYRWTDPSGVAAQALASYDGGMKVDHGYGPVSKGTESTYQPFGAGRHRCIGETFAYLQLGTILSTLVRKLEMRIEKGIPKHNYHTLMVQPHEPCGILYRRRTTQLRSHNLKT